MSAKDYLFDAYGSVDQQKVAADNDYVVELAAFKAYGARQKRDELSWEPAWPETPGPCVGLSPSGCVKPGTEKVGDAWLCRDCYDRRPWKTFPATSYKLTYVNAKTGLETPVPLPGLKYEGTITNLTIPMKCPLCGTNPGRCDKALDSTETKCFSCGRELEAL